MQITIFVFLFSILIEQNPPSFQEGDIIFQTSVGSLSSAIQIATHSQYSHVGIIFKQGNQLMVLEAIQPVQVTPLQAWIERGKGEHYVVKRLKNVNKILNKNVLEKMKSIGKRYLGKDYDIYFEWTDERFYCSELVWKIYQEATGIEIGQLKALKDFDLTSETVRKKLREHYGNQIPYNEKIISPDAMFQSDLLEVVVNQ